MSKELDETIKIVYEKNKDLPFADFWRTDDTSLGKYVYCSAHLRVHTTGWCSVNNGDKIGLKSDTLEEANIEAAEMGVLLV